MFWPLSPRHRDRKKGKAGLRITLYHVSFFTSYIEKVDSNPAICLQVSLLGLLQWPRKSSSVFSIKNTVVIATDILSGDDKKITVVRHFLKHDILQTKKIRWIRFYLLVCIFFTDFIHTYFFLFVYVSWSMFLFPMPSKKGSELKVPFH